MITTNDCDSPLKDKLTTAFSPWSTATRQYHANNQYQGLAGVRFNKLQQSRTEVAIRNSSKRWDTIHLILIKFLPLIFFDSQLPFGNL